jgi:signal peptidase I
MDNKPRKWWVAGLLSLFEPGLGQTYNGQACKGLIFLALCLLFLTAMILCLNSYKILLFFILALLTVVCYITVVADAIYTAHKFKKEYKLKKYNKFIAYLGFIAIVIATNIIIPSYKKKNSAQPYRINSVGMEPTLLIGDRIVTDQRLSAKNPNRGDLIVFESPKDPKKDFVQRVVAIGGDIVEIRNKVLLINNMVITETFAVHNDSNVLSISQSPRDNFGPVTVPENSYFVMSDNRDNSYDSRFLGFVKKSKIKGTVKDIFWSWDREKNTVRWNRIGKITQ